MCRKRRLLLLPLLPLLLLPLLPLLSLLLLPLLPLGRPSGKACLLPSAIVLPIAPESGVVNVEFNILVKTQTLNLTFWF